MARPNIARIKKSELIKMNNWRCKHGETGLSHYQCWLREHPDTERIGFLDIECSNLDADFGIVLTYCIKIKDEDKIYERTITPRDLRTCLDKRVIEQCVKDLKNFDRVITYYGSRFDIPFLRTRAISLGVPFPGFGELLHNDVYFAARGRLCMSSKRLDNVCRTLFGATEKTRIEPKYWIKALMGDKESLEYLSDHCRRDVIELERVYNALMGFTRKTDNSI